MKTKNTIKTTLFLIMIVLTIYSATALTFTQTTQSATAGTISAIKTTGTFAMATDGTIILFWNATEWNQISKPTGETNPLIAFTKASDKKFYWSFGTNNSIKTYSYTPTNNYNCPSCWTLKATSTPSSTFQFVTTGQDVTLACVDEGAGYTGSTGDAECYLLERNSTFEIRGRAIIDSTTDTTILTASTLSGMKMLSGTRISFSRNDGTSATLMEWTGVGFTQQVSVIGGTSVSFDGYTRANANIKAYSQTSATGSLFDVFNATTGTYPAPSTNFPTIANRKIQLDNTATKLYSITGRNLTSVLYGQTTFTQEFQNPAVSNFATFDTDWTTGNIWVAGNNGLIYGADIQSYTPTTTTTAEQTNYNITSYQTTLNAYSSVVSLDKLTTNKLFAVGLENSQPVLISVDLTNPNNLLVKDKNITQLSGFNYPTSISLGNSDRAFIGTDDELYLFNNISFGDATQTTQDGTSYDLLFSGDYFYDVSAKNDEINYLCRAGSPDDARRFNATSLSFTHTISESPCLTIEYVNDLILIHKGTSGIKIYNETTLNLLATISGINSQGIGTTHDRITTFGNVMFAITGQTQISQYDLSDPSAPVKIADCYTTSEVYSLEAINENEIIIGVVGGGGETTTGGALKVCDFSNTATIETTTGIYTSTLLKTYTEDELPQEINLLDNNGKFAVAENNRIGIYQYTKTTSTVTINNAPVIDSITTATNSICINQTVQVSIEATDVDSTDLRYDWDCNGIQSDLINNFGTNTFTCSYTSSGTKTIKAFVTDTLLTTSATRTINVVSNCTNSNFLNFNILDGSTGAPIDGVSVSVTGQSNTTSNSAGQTSTTTTTSGTFSVSFSKDGYLSATNQYTTFNGIYTVYLEPTTDPTTGELRSTLFVTVIDSSSNPIPYVTVASTDPITAIAKVTQTNSLGIATLQDLSTNLELRISAGKSGYATEFTTVVMQIGETQSITITLETSAEASQTNFATGRGCSDYIKGVILCTPLNINGTGDNCNSDSDCITGRCEAPVSSQYRTCAKFNWTYCDDRGLDRGNRCFAMATSGGLAEEGTNALTNNLKYFLAFLVLVGLMLVIIKSVKRSN